MKPDEAYIAERNSFIPLAEDRANKEFGCSSRGKLLKEKKEYAANWNRVYHATMNRLWREHEKKPQENRKA